MAMWAPVRNLVTRAADSPVAYPFAHPLGPRLGSEGAAAAWTPADFATLYLWATNVYASAAPPLADDWENLGGSWGDGSPGNKPDIIDPDADVTTGKSLEFIEAGAEWFEFGTTTTVKPLHDGTGVSLGMLFKGADNADTSQCLWGTHLPGVAIGASATLATPAGTVQTRVGNGTSLVVDHTTVAGTFANGVVNAYGFYLQDNPSGNDWEVWSAVKAGVPVIQGQGTLAAAVSTSNAADLLNIAVRGSSLSWWFEGRVAAVVAGAGYEMPNLMDYLQSLIV